jgi:hypothetical protein
MSTYIINPKAEKVFPTECEFAARIETYTDDIVYVAQCKHCGGKIGGRIKAAGASKMKERRVNAIVLSFLAKNHVCQYKTAQWSDKSLPGLIAPDIMQGMEKLKAEIEKNKRLGKA